ncbi:MAG: response regulator [Candidatus Helarchaeota archaeon]
MKILIVDDDEIFLDKMKKNLTLDDHIVTTATSGEIALQKLDKQKFDLILSDLKMPGLSGVEFLKTIRGRGIDTILIMITGYGTIETAVEAMKKGAYDYLLKPFEMNTLRNKLTQVEIDINLRKDLPVTRNFEKSIIRQDLGQLNIEEFEGPFLIISEQDPKIISQKLKISDFTSILLDNAEENSSITPIFLYSLKTKIKEFFEQNKKGTIIFNGIEGLLKTYNWEDLKKFIAYLLSEIITLKYSLIILIGQDCNFLDSTQERNLNNSLSLFINPIFNKIINLLSHPLRKNIITLLKSENRLNFNKIAKKLEVDRSSVLAFHINKLMKENIIKKDENLYYLSEIGLYFVEIITQLENLGFSYPDSQIKLFKIP